MATIPGTLAPDFLLGTAAGDLIDGLAGDDLIYGFDGDDTLLGGAGDDILYGGSGNDRIDGAAGEDMIFGQSGIDLVTYATATTAILLNLDEASLSLGDAVGDIFVSIERFALTALNDTLVGSGLADYVHAGDGGDLMFGNAGNDTLFGDAGDDTLVGGAGADELSGGLGFDWASYQTATEGLTLDLEDPVNTTGDAAGDVYIKIEGLLMGQFNDTLVLAGEIVTADGGAGDDVMAAGVAASTLFGGLGSDEVTGGFGNDLLDGGDGNDTLIGNAGRDTLSGGAGDDSLMGGTGADALDGGLGVDTVAYTNSVRLDLGNPAFSKGDAKGDTLTGIEQIVFTQGNSTYVGSSTGMAVLATGGTLSARAGSGAELFAALGGQLSVTYAAAVSAVTLIMTDSGLAGARGAAGDMIQFADSLALTARADVLIINHSSIFATNLVSVDALGGNDALTLSLTTVVQVDAGAGNDTVDGFLRSGTVTLGTGDDQVSLVGEAPGLGQPSLVVIGGEGQDSITVGGQNMQVSVSGDAGNDTLSVDAPGNGIISILGGDGDDLIFAAGTTSPGVQGGLGNDTILASAQTIFGTMDGGEGDDFMEVDALAGIATGGVGDDTMIFNQLVKGAGTALLDGGEGNDTLTITSNIPDSTLPGNVARFLGGLGDDLLIDETASGFVTSVFVFNADWGDDTVTGYSAGRDFIGFVGTGAAGLDSFDDLVITGDTTQTLISFGADSILLDGFDIADFGQSDVVFS